MNLQSNFSSSMDFNKQSKDIKTNNQGFIDKLYTNYNFQFYKDSKVRQKDNSKQKIKEPQIKKKRTRLSQKQKRQQRIKMLVRQSNLKQFETIEEITRKQKSVKSQESRILNNRFKKKKHFPEHVVQELQYVGLIDVQKNKKRAKHQAITYLDTNKIMNTDKPTYEIPSNEDCYEIKANNQQTNFVNLGQTYFNNKQMYELNKAIHDKSTYRFNVLWWDQDKQTEEYKEQLARGLVQEEDSQYLEPEIRKNLKKVLKPLRKHKLISTRYAPIAMFSPQLMMNREALVNEGLTSESEEDQKLFDDYDKQAYEEINPSGAINLEEDENKRKRNSKKKNYKTHWQFSWAKKNKSDFERANCAFENGQIDKRLKRALRRVNDDGWEEDKLYTRGNQEDKPVNIEEIYQ